MITVPEVVRTIIYRSPYLIDGLSRDILNLSGLARDIKQKIEEETMKDVQIGSIVMALKRLQPKIKSQNPRITFVDAPEIIVRSNLFEVTISNSQQSRDSYRKLLEVAGNNADRFTTITQGVFETTIIASEEAKTALYALIDKQAIISEISDISSITIKFPQNIIDTPGVYASVLKTLAWNGIPMTEIVSTFSELTIIVKNQHVSDSFSLIRESFKK